MVGRRARDGGGSKGAEHQHERNLAPDPPCCKPGPGAKSRLALAEVVLRESPMLRSQTAASDGCSTRRLRQGFQRFRYTKVSGGGDTESRAESVRGSTARPGRAREGPERRGASRARASRYNLDEDDQLPPLPSSQTDFLPPSLPCPHPLP